MSTYFFTGGTFPSADLFLYFQQYLTIEQTWHVNGWSLAIQRLIEGKHYARTCEDWLKLLQENRAQAKQDLKETYGDNAEVWYNRWIVFYLVVNFLMAKLTVRVAPSYLPVIMGMSGLWHIISFQRSRPA